MALNGFQYRSGPWDCATRATKASTALGVLDGVKTVTGKLELATTGAKVDGVALQSKAAGDSATTAVQYIKSSSGRTVFVAGEKRASGSLAATDEGDLHDIKGATGAQGFDSSATTNKDLYIDKVLVAGDGDGDTDDGQALIKFADPSYLHATN